jgi:Arc/MetJ-type ribon-helix-helix transcriptional regulator
MADTEKITINMNVVDLGRIDLLVEQGFYSSRSDFIRAAIRQQLLEHADKIKDVVLQPFFGVGVQLVSKEDLEKELAKGHKVTIRHVGLLVIADDVTPELAMKAIQSVKAYGTVKATQEVKVALGLK